jgi:hypothetical protein
MATLKQTKEALEGSIRKWELIEAEIGGDDGANNCPLCKIFNVKYGCKGCPVAFITECDGCNHTPYDDWCDHQSDVHDLYYNIEPFKVECDECKALAHEMLEFLIRLRPIVDVMFDIQER